MTKIFLRPMLLGLALVFFASGFARAADSALNPEVFDWQYYTGHHPDLSGMDEAQATSHWLNYGINEGRQGSLYFWSRDYFELYPFLKSALGNDNRKAIENYVSYGMSHGRVGVLALSPDVYDSAFYLQANPDLQSILTSASLARTHWLSEGLASGRRAALLFSVEEYRLLNPDLNQLGVASNEKAIEHYMLTGLKESRPGLLELSPEIFNRSFYEKASGLSFASLKDARTHWISTGLPQSHLKASPDFDVNSYLSRYPDLASTIGSDPFQTVRDYLLLGRSAKRLGLLSLEPVDWYSRMTRDTVSPVIAATDDRTETFTSADGRPVTITVKGPAKPLATIQIAPLAGGEDATPVFAAAIAQARSIGASVVSIQPGRYVFKTAGSIAHLNLENLKDFTLSGNGATLVFTQPVSGISIINSQRLKINYVRIDWEGLPIASGGTIEPDPSTGKNVLRIDPKYGIDPATPIEVVSLYDTAARKWTKSAKAEAFYNPDPPPVYSAATQTYSSSKFDSFPAGSTVLVRHYAYKGNAVRIYGTQNEEITLKSVIVYSAPGMAFYINGLKRGLWMTNCTVRALMENPLRLISAATDGIHLRNPGADLIIEGNNISQQGDDGLNLGAASAKVLSVSGDGLSVTITSPNQLVEDGNELALFNSGLGYLGEAKIKTNGVHPVYVNNVKYYTLDLDRSVAGLQSDGFVRNLTRSGARYIIRNNTFKDNRARGLIVQSPLGLVEGNTIENTTMTGLMVLSDASDWFEGVGAADVIVRGNTIRGTGWSQINSEGGALTVMGKLPSGIAMFPAHQGLDISGNTISNVPGPCLLLGSVRKANVNGNSCENANQDPTSLWLGAASMSGSIVISHSHDIHFSNNVRSGTSTGAVSIDDLTTSGLELQPSY